MAFPGENMKFAIIALLFYSTCSPDSAKVNVKPTEFPPVQLNMESGTYYIPGCPLYDHLVDRVRLDLPTAQEAELSGYRIGQCPEGARDERVAAERQHFGEIKATNETRERWDRLRIRHDLRGK